MGINDLIFYNVQGNLEEEGPTKEGETEDGEIEPIDGSCLDVSGVEEVASVQDPAKFACNICKKNYTHKRYLIRHLKSHDANAIYVRCSDCITYFKDRQPLLQHSFKKTPAYYFWRLW